MRAPREPGAQAKGERSFRAVWERQKKVVKSESQQHNRKKKKKEKLTDERRGPGNCRKTQSTQRWAESARTELGALQNGNWERCRGAVSSALNGVA